MLTSLRCVYTTPLWLHPRSSDLKSLAELELSALCSQLVRILTQPSLTPRDVSGSTPSALTLTGKRTGEVFMQHLPCVVCSPGLLYLTSACGQGLQCVQAPSSHVCDDGTG
jgi:hypothetical protein